MSTPLTDATHDPAARSWVAWVTEFSGKNVWLLKTPLR